MIPLGVLKVNVELGQRQQELDLYVFGGNIKPIVGRDWIEAFKLVTINKQKFVKNCCQKQSRNWKEFIQ